MQYHPRCDLIFLVLHGRNTLATIDPSDPAAPITMFPSAGKVPSIREYAALEYSPILDTLVYYSAVDGNHVYAADCGARAHWQVVTARAALDPIADAAAGSRYPLNLAHTFGRFRIAHFDDVDLAILVRHVDSPVYAMRIC